MALNPRHFQLRARTDRKAKKGRCSCGWEGPWRSTVSTGHRRRDAHHRSVLIRGDFEVQHLADVERAGC